MLYQIDSSECSSFQKLVGNRLLFESLNMMTNYKFNIIFFVGPNCPIINTLRCEASFHVQTTLIECYITSVHYVSVFAEVKTYAYLYVSSIAKYVSEYLVPF